MEFQGHYLKKDYFKASSLASFPSKRRQWVSISVFGLFVILYIVFLVLEFQSGVLQDNLSGSLRYGFMILLYGYLTLSRFITFRIRLARIWADPLTRRLVQGELAAEGIVISPLKDTALKWVDISKVHRLANMYVLVTPTKSMFALPSYFFDTTAEWESAKQLIDRKVIEAV